MSDDMEAIEVGALIPDPEVFHDLHITAMTGWRWDRDPRMAALGWPPPIYRGPLQVPRFETVPEIQGDAAAPSNREACRTS
jgi:hypothetical protein